MHIANVWQARTGERRGLKELDAPMPRDVGLAAANLEHEAAKPFWRA